MTSKDEILRAYEPFGEAIVEVKPARVEALSELMFDQGQITYSLPLLKDRREACMTEFVNFGGYDKLLKEGAETVQSRVYLSEKCNMLLNKTLKKYVHE